MWRPTLPKTAPTGVAKLFVLNRIADVNAVESPARFGSASAYC
jgi:hypothetical protein